MSKQIKVASGEMVTVDDEDFEWASKYNWHLYSKYAGRKISRSLNGGRQRVMLMHIEVMERNGRRGDINLEVDHKNRNYLDNQKDNLRWATRAQNLANRTQNNNTSGCRNVYWSKQHRKWRVTFGFNRRRVEVGLFSSLQDAIEHRNRAVKRYYGEFAIQG